MFTAASIAKFEEDTAELQFGQDFNDEKCLNNAEVLAILSQQKASYEESDKEITPMFAKTLTYVKRFSCIKDVEANSAAIVEMRSSLEGVEIPRAGGGEGGEDTTLRLHQYEIASLINLMQADSVAEEAVALIPSLGGSRFTDEETGEILDIIKAVPNRFTG